MDVRGPCFLSFHNGQPCSLYEVTTSEKSMKGFNTVRYFFTNWEDAEIYTYYLYQVNGVDSIKRLLVSKKIPKWEKDEYAQFLETLDLTTLEQLASHITPIVEKAFIPHLTKRTEDGEEDYTDDDCGEYGC